MPNDAVPGLGLVPLLVPGTVLLIAVRMVYAHRRGRQTDAVYTMLTVAAWLLMMLGLLGGLVALTSWLVLLVLVVIAVVAVVALLRFLKLERRMLIGALALALERGIPLPEAIRAFAEERSLIAARPALRLAAWLESGVPLAEAAKRSGCRFPASVRLAIAASEGHGSLPTALRRSVGELDYFDSLLLPAAAKLLVLCVVVVVGVFIVTCEMYYVVPVFAKMFDDFEVELPTATKILVAVINHTVQFWGLAVLAGVAANFVLIAAGVLYYLGALERLPLIGRLWWPLDRAALLRSLAFAVQSGRPLAATIGQLARMHPRASVRRRLRGCRADLERGGEWCDALQAQRLLRPTDAALLRSAERAGNLVWALEETADGALRRSALRVRAVLAILFPVVIMGLGAVVGLIVVGLFLPLVTLIWKLL